MLNCIISPPRTDGYFERGDTRPNVSVVLATFLRINVTGQATGKLSIFAGASGSPVIPPAKAFSILDHEENATNTPRSKSRNAHTLAHASAFTRRWGVTARATRERRSRRHCKFHGGLSIRRELVSKAHQSRWWTKHDRARVYTRGGLSIFANFLPSHSIARCLWPTPLIVVARQQSISAHDIRTQPRLRILRVCLFFFYFSFFLSFFFFFPLVFIPCEVTPWLIHSILLSIPWLFAQRAPTNWFTRFIWDRWEETWPRKTAASRIMFLFFFRIISFSGRDFVLKEMREKETL